MGRAAPADLRGGSAALSRVRRRDAHRRVHYAAGGYRSDSGPPAPRAGVGARAAEYAAPGAGGDRAAACLICSLCPSAAIPRGSVGCAVAPLPPPPTLPTRRRAHSDGRRHRSDPPPNDPNPVIAVVSYRLRWRTPSRARSHGTLAARGAIGFPTDRTPLQPETVLRPEPDQATVARVRHATPRHATPRHATPRHATPRRAERATNAGRQLVSIDQVQREGVGAGRWR